MIIRLRRNDNLLRRMIICLRQNEGEFPRVARKFPIFKSNASGKFWSTFFKKFTLACGKLRLCLVGSRLHFPSENRQSRTEYEAEPHFNARA